MNYQERDQALVNEVCDALVKRHTINLNREIGKAYFQAELEDKINPCVTLTDEAIRRITRRSDMRNGPVLNYYEDTFRARGFEVTRPVEPELRICVTPIRVKENEFSSLEELRTNEKDLDNNPELGEVPY
jgi:hypothetical protein